MEQQQIFDDLLKILKKDLQILPDKSEENPENTLRALWLLANGIRVSPILAENTVLPALSPTQVNALEELVKERLSGIPLAHLTERQHYMGLDYILNKGLYIPRKETELLAKIAIETILSDFDGSENINVMDLCTGIGTVAVAIAYYCKNTRAYGSDIYEPAIQAASINAKHFGLGERVTFFHADLFNPFESLSLKENTQIIVSAPPYISTPKVSLMADEISNHEPEEAFNAGPFGLSVFNQLIAISPEYLCKNGYLIFECGLGQGEFLANRLKKNNRYGEVTPICDEKGNVRVLKARKIY
jgi:release factor glutamine methyltransferase